jgi:hypothetical protein
VIVKILKNVWEWMRITTMLFTLKDLTVMIPTRMENTRLGPNGLNVLFLVVLGIRLEHGRALNLLAKEAERSVKESRPKQKNANCVTVK